MFANFAKIWRCTLLAILYSRLLDEFTIVTSFMENHPRTQALSEGGGGGGEGTGNDCMRMRQLYRKNLLKL